MRVSERGMHNALKNREPFATYKDTMVGERFTSRVVGMADVGFLAQKSNEDYNDFVITFMAGDLDYVVWSYRTPIAWVKTNGEVVIPNIKYSVTTTRHQSVVKRYL